jgi:hypothetical protein
MASPQNINAVDLNTNTGAKSKDYFNNFFVDLGTISPLQNDTIVAFFERFTGGNPEAASALTSAVIFTSLSQGEDPMAVLTQFTKMNAGELNSYLTMFLNLNRVGTSFLGLNNQPPINKYVQRSIIL